MTKKIIFFLLPILMYGQSQIGQDIDGTYENEFLGRSVDLSANGEIIAIGASGYNTGFINMGQVNVFENIDNEWIQIGQPINGFGENDFFGYAVSISAKGDTVAIGAIEEEGSPGYVQVYENQKGQWVQIGQTLNGAFGGDLYGFSISLSNYGTKLAVGAPNNNQNGSISGQVRVYEIQEGNWNQLGQNINGEGASDNSGYSLDLSGNGLFWAIGAPGNNDGGTNAGHARVYEYQNDNWIQVSPDFNGGQTGINSGSSVSISDDGKVIAIGAVKSRSRSGSVSIYDFTFGAWNQLGDTIYGGESNSNSGFSISLSSDGTIIAIGAVRNDASGIDSGNVRVYKNVQEVWTKVLNDIPGESAGDRSGESVSLSSDGSIVAIGAPNNSPLDSMAGHVRIYELTETLHLITPEILKEINIYPNPTTNVIYLEKPSQLEIQTLTIHDNLGRILPFKGTTKTIQTSHLTQGHYFIKILTNAGNTVRKIVKL